MTVKPGDKMPSVTLMEMTPDGPQPQKTDEVFAGKTVALFAVPGAFTPTCSAKHLPGFMEKAADLKAKGVDEIICTSVNDPFVMGAWAEQSGSGDTVRMLADGNGDLARGLGLQMDGSGFGLGERSRRYSMIVKDGVVDAVNAEEGGEYKVSSADYLLGQI